MVPNNLSKFIAIEKLLQGIQSGIVALSLKVERGNIKSVSIKGIQKTLYNQTVKDEKTNELALKYIGKRILSQLEREQTGELSFKIKNFKNKIMTVELESTQNI